MPLAEQSTVLVADLLAEPLRVPQSMGVDSLLGVLRSQGFQIAIVRTSTAAPTGVVTLEDLVEELVGELEDEHDRPRTEVRPRRTLGDLRRLAAARRAARPRRRSRSPRTGSTTPSAGFVTDELDRIPELGDEVAVARRRPARRAGRRGRVDRLRFIPADAEEDLTSVSIHDVIVDQLRKDLS